MTGFKKNSCDICDNDFLALPENISQGLVATVTRDLEEIQKLLVAVVTIEVGVQNKKE